MLLIKTMLKYIMIGILFSFITAHYDLSAAAFGDIPVKMLLDRDVDLIDYSNVVIPQVGEDCGLHALKNSSALFNYIIGAIDVQERNRLLQSQSVGNIPSMAACRVALRGARGSLDPEAIHELAEMLPEPYNISYKHNKLLILDNLQSAQLMRPDIEKKQLADTVEKMRSGSPFVQAFILGSMNQLTKKMGHWVAAVLARSEQGERIVLHMADSMGAAGIAFDISIGRQLLDFLRSLNPDILRLGQLEELFEILNRNLENENYSAALINVDDLINKALLFGVLSGPFDQQFEFLSELLMQVQDEVLSEPERILKEEVLTKLSIRGDLQAQFDMQELQFMPLQGQAVYSESLPILEKPEVVECPSKIQPFNEAELKFRLDRFISPTYRSAFMKDASAMARLHASFGVTYYDEIMARYPELQPIVEQAQPSVLPFNEAEMQFRLIKFASPSYVKAFIVDTNAMARLRASSGVKYYPEIMEIIERYQ